MNGVPKRLLVHRKGSTRAFPPHHPLIPVDYQMIGQPVLIGGTMGTHSYVLTGMAPLPFTFPHTHGFRLFSKGCLTDCVIVLCFAALLLVCRA